MKTKYILQTLMIFLTLGTLSLAGDTARIIERNAYGALSQFHHEVKGSKAYLKNAKAYLVFPDITEGGFFIGGKYGEGVLRIGDITKSFHSITGLSAGFQVGLQNYALIIAITSQTALDKFLLNTKWETNVDINMAMAEWNSDTQIDDIDFGADMVGFVFDSTGMMGSISFEGIKFERIKPGGQRASSYRDR